VGSKLCSFLVAVNYSKHFLHLGVDYMKGSGLACFDIHVFFLLKKYKCTRKSQTSHPISGLIFEPEAPQFTIVATSR